MVQTGRTLKIRSGVPYPDLYYDQCVENLLI